MTPAGVELVEAGADRDLLAAFAHVMLATQPEWSRSVDHLVHSLAVDPGLRRVVAIEDGEPVGCASAGRVWVFPPDSPVAWAEVGVLADRRGRGIGAALLAWAGEAAAAMGKDQLQVPCSSARPEGVAFLERRGYAEYDRMAGLELPLAGVEAPAFALPEGVRLADLAAEPGLRASAYDLAVEVFASLPDPEPVSAGTYDEWVARDVDVPDAPLDAYLLAVEGDRAVGMCRLMLAEGGSVVSHSMTGTLRSHRGRGIATALKRAAIGWALAHGAERITTENAVGNATMQGINRELGFVDAPAFIELRGPALAS
jgi:GNAT superfamily N-acetyltransferase